MKMPPPTAAGLADLDDLASAVGAVHLVMRRPRFDCPSGAVPFEPMAGRTMTGWVRVSRASSDHWHDLAHQAAATPLS